MPVLPGKNSRQPKSWEEVKNGNFYIINGQHSVAASKLMMEEGSGVSEDVQQYFKTWNCFIVWSLSAEKLRSISAYYNRVNHFQAIQPSWATNILGARSVWIAMGRPKHPKGDGTGPALARKDQNSLSTKFKVSNSGRSDLNCISLKCNDWSCVCCCRMYCLTCLIPISHCIAEIRESYHPTICDDRCQQESFTSKEERRR
jgi:hypothetical protein